MKFGLQVLVTVTLLSGCGGESPYRTAPVSGVLKCQGKPVAGVYIVFSPKEGKGRSANLPGRPGTAITDENGQFVLSTYGNNDGAVIGMHSVSATPNEDPRNPKSAGAMVLKPCFGKTLNIEVKRGMAPLSLDLGESSIH